MKGLWTQASARTRLTIYSTWEGLSLVSDSAEAKLERVGQ